MYLPPDGQTVEEEDEEGHVEEPMAVSIPRRFDAEVRLDRPGLGVPLDVNLTYSRPKLLRGHNRPCLPRYPHHPPCRVQ